jgi:hypothetical protein
MQLRLHCSVSGPIGRAIALAVVAACAATPAHPVPLAVLVDGTPASRVDLPAVDGLAPHAVVVPPAPPDPPDRVSGPVARARKAYAAGELEACRAELARVDVPAALAAGARDSVARALAFDAACAWGAQAHATARELARRLAAFGLAVPDVAIAPDIEAVLGEAIVAAGNARPRPVAVRGVVGARLAVDGRPPVCTLPCTVDLIAGDHVLAVTADGFADAHRVVRVPDTTDVTLSQPPAPPAVAAAQWRARAARGLPTTDAIGARLIAQLGGERRIAVLHPGEPLVGALILDGAVVASGSAPRDGAAGLLRELAYDSGVLQRPSVWQRPWFWIAISALALGAAGAITALTYHPQRTSLTL